MDCEIFVTTPAIILLEYLTDGDSDIPIRRNRKRRIQKKWAKKYGYRPRPNPGIYFTKDAVYMHPDTYRQLCVAIGEHKVQEEFRKAWEEHVKKQEETE